MIKLNPFRIVFTPSGFIKGCLFVVGIAVIALFMHILAEYELGLIAESVENMRAK